MKSLLFFLIAFFCNQTVGAFYQKTLLHDVKSLTLHQGLYTTGRRGLPVPQLNCIGGSASSESHKVRTVQCTNTGFDGRDYNWRCESEMDKSLKFGKISVSCEGYDYPDDPYVLVGSCGLEYTLDYTGHQSVLNVQPPTHVQQKIVTTTTTYSKSPDNSGVVLGQIAFALLTAAFTLIIVLALIEWCQDYPENRSSGSYRRRKKVETEITSPPVVVSQPPVVVSQTPVVVKQTPVVVSQTPVIVASAPVNTVYHPPPPPGYTVTHTETVINNQSSSNEDKHTSVGYGGTKRR